MPALPTLFISHGAPTFALEPGIAGRALAELGARLPRPRAVLVLSPHWMHPVATLTGAAKPDTIHDFGGFDRALYDLDYPAPGAPDVAGAAAKLLQAAGIAAHIDPRRGRDHGAWVPMMHLYPDADVPVIQLAMPQGGSPRALFDLGRALAPLREGGVLIVGSGSLTHNLYEFAGTAPRAADPYVTAFAEWIADTLARGDTDALLDYRNKAPHAARAHPTDEHLTPLMFALGAAAPGATPQRIASDDVRYGMLAMDLYRFDA